MQPLLPDTIYRKLQLLKRTLRFYAALDGIAAVLIVAAALFWIDLALDRFFEFSQPMRLVLLIIEASILGMALFRWVLRRCFALISRGQLASVFEKFVPSLKDSLITAIELESLKRKDHEDFDPVLFERTVQDALEELRSVNIRKFFRVGRIARQVLIAAVLALLISVFFIQFSETSQIWFSRNILLSQQEYPRKSELVVEGFKDGKVRIGRGDSFTLTVRANTAMPLIPEIIKLRIGSRKSGFRTLVMDQFRMETVNNTDWRAFSYTFSECLETLPFTVRGADSFIDGLEIEVVPPPMLSDISIRQEFPKYMNRSTRNVAAAARTTIPDGTTIQISGTANKSLKTAEVLTKVEGNDSGISPATIDGDAISYSVKELRKETALEFKLEDNDNLRNKKAIKLDFTIAKDQAPEITAKLDGIGSAITPNAVLPAAGEISDDYGLASVDFRYTVEKGIVEENKIAKEEERKEEKAEDHKPDEGKSAAKAQSVVVKIEQIKKDTSLYTLADKNFSVADSKAEPGDKLLLCVEALDLFDLDGEKGQVGVGPQWTLEIVTPEKLKSLLEIREISLRQRFEVLIGEVEKTKGMVSEFSLEVPLELQQQANAMKLPEAPTPSLSAEEKAKQEAELEAKKKALLDTVSQQLAGIADYNISRTLRDTQKESYETRTITESFKLIRQEMVNNKIFADEVKDRLDKGIITPMQRLFNSDFPETDRLTEILKETLAVRDKPLRLAALKQQQEVLAQFDLVLKNMRAIRDSMVSMESFNEAIDLLRAILKEQQRLRDETQEERKRTLKGLLEQ